MRNIVVAADAIELASRKTYAPRIFTIAYKVLISIVGDFFAVKSFSSLPFFTTVSNNRSNTIYLRFEKEKRQSTHSKRLSNNVLRDFRSPIRFSG